ncbi:MAG: FAD-dependent oxidoreductase, partial [Armatimonadota bacterium]|nr:FAD-dependent oxidoreductase [Armatimonadota bacterium]
MSTRTVVILGGGVGGLVAADELRRRLPREHRIVLVEKDSQHTFAPSYLWLMTGDRKPEQISAPLHRLVRPGIEVVVAEAQGIDLAARRIETSTGQLDYDYLVIALGAELAPDAIPGLADASHTFYTFDGARNLHEALQTFEGGKVAVVVSAMPYK